MKSLRVFALIALAAIAFVEVADAQTRHSRRDRKAHYSNPSNIEIAVMGVGQDGTKVVKVWGYGRRVEDAVIEAKKNAVAAAIFTGIPGGHGAAATPAILRDPNADEKHADYFDEFFAPDGRWVRFLSLTTDGTPSGQDRIKIDRKNYKVAIQAQILYDNLRKQLEADGIARRLDQGF